MEAVRTEQMEQPLMQVAPDVRVSLPELGIRLHPVLDRTESLSREAATAISAMLSPAAAIALGLGFWRLGADLGWTGQFAISSGLFSHWQVWFGLAVVVQVLAATILRAGHTR